MERAWAIVALKSVEGAEERIISGVATTPTMDREGDIVEPMGAEFKLPLPLLAAHDHRQPVGHVLSAKPGPMGIRFRARLASLKEPSPLKDRLDEHWHAIKAGLIRAVSIGFRGLAYEPLRDGGRRFTRWEWLELSTVTVPANQEATIDAVKAIDAAARMGAAWPPHPASGPSAPAYPLGESAIGDGWHVRQYGPVAWALEKALSSAADPPTAGTLAPRMIGVAARATDAALADLHQRIARLEGSDG